MAKKQHPELDPEIARILEETRQRRRAAREERRANPPQVRGYKGKPEWQAACRDAQFLMHELRTAASAAFPDATFKVSLLTYSPRFNREPFVITLHAHHGPSADALEAWAAPFIARGASMAMPCKLYFYSRGEIA